MGKIKAKLIEEIDEMEETGRLSPWDYYTNNYVLMDGYKFPDGYQYQYDGVIWEDDYLNEGEECPVGQDIAVECLKSPTGDHEWAGSGVPKGMEWCKYCDIDKPEEK